MTSLKIKVSPVINNANANAGATIRLVLTPRLRKAVNSLLEERRL